MASEEHEKILLIKTRVRNDSKSDYFFFPHCRIHNEVAGKMGPAGLPPLVLNARFNALKPLPLACGAGHMLLI